MKLKEPKIPYHVPFPLFKEDIEVIKWKIEDALEAGKLTNGEYVLKLEEKVAKMYNVDYCIATANCTIGLLFCYQYYQLGRIHMPNFTWFSPYLITPERGHDFHDIDPNTWLIQESDVPNDVLVSPCHTFGSIIKFEREYEVIYDGAHAFGADIKEIGDATVFSLAPTKLVTSCEGGLVITNQPRLADFVRFRRDKCARMSEVHAIIGLQTLPYIDDVMARKEAIYKYYKKHLPGQFQEIKNTSSYNTIGFLNVNNLIIPPWVETRQYYEPLLRVDLLPNSYRVYMKMVCLPSYYIVDYRKVVRDILEVNEL